MVLDCSNWISWNLKLSSEALVIGEGIFFNAAMLNAFSLTLMGFLFF